MRGNTKKVEQTTLKSLYITQDLSVFSYTKCLTRHFTNACFYLSPSDNVLLNWLTYYSNAHNVFTYSTQLLKVYDRASDRAIEIYGSEIVNYTTSMTNARMSFISLVEKGMVIKLTRKAQYMINPYMIYTKSRLYPPSISHKRYLNVVNNYKGEELSKELTKLCDSIQKMFEDDIDRTNPTKRRNNAK